MAKKPERDKPVDKRAKFIDEYVKDLNATQAAIRAGYSPKTANEQGARLLANVSIRAEVDKRIQAASAETGITAANVLREIARVGFSDVVHLVDEAGHLRSLHEIPEAQRRAIQSIKVKRFVEGKGDDAETFETLEYKLWSKTAALSDLAKHLRLFYDPSDAVLALLAALPHELGREVSELIKGTPPAGVAGQSAVAPASQSDPSEQSG